MKSVNALRLRQCLGDVLKDLLAGGSPILVEKGHQPAAVLISLQDYKTRFADRDADDARLRIVEEIRATRLQLKPGESVVGILRRVRNAEA